METFFPWRAGNRFELLVDGHQFFPAMLEGIQSAKQEVLLELYLVEEGRCSQLLVEALCLAARRGVTVRCLFDGFGARALSKAARRRLEQAGVMLRLYNPLHWRQGFANLRRDHRKLLLIDRKTAFIGGTGATDNFWQPGEAQSLCHELMVRCIGAITLDFYRLFEQQWSPPARPWRQIFWGATRRSRLPAPPAISQGMGRLAWSDAVTHRELVQSLLRHIHHARQRIWLATPYFLPSWKVRRALRKAAQRGVDVQLLLASNNIDHGPVRYASHRYYPSLLRAGVRIHEYSPRFLHLKLVLADGWISVGSCNFDHWNLRFNLEANLEAQDEALTRACATCLQQGMADGQEITLEHWQQRPLYRRLLERLWGLIDQLILNLLDKRD
ncbi:cardiolipin synthase B [Ventosimonas gracilis]|uniref:Cardiolipin synthase B n=1 Tax=Ventosimonas gracilis TaxID=1680762 RepID=A0A139SXJ8_9GAMM|nr:phospholipase D-like domain-containing protein [Ventosimonas gracilis]KXU39326.1 cardiolipin synthase B [Ventosimonas gracilis]